MWPSVRTVQCLTILRMTLDLLYSQHNRSTRHRPTQSSPIGYKLPRHLLDASSHHKLAFQAKLSFDHSYPRCRSSPRFFRKKQKMRCWRAPSEIPPHPIQKKKEKKGGEDLTQPFCFRYASCIRRALVLLLTGMLFSHARTCSTFPKRQKKMRLLLTSGETSGE